MHINRFIVFLFILNLHSLSGQDFQVIHYRAVDGLRSDLVKCVIQDSLGFMWIGSDNGLVKFDGVKFTHYPKATPSSYIKDFVKLPNGRILAIHDLGVIEIDSRIDTVLFKPVLEGARRPEDNKVWYAKGAYPDERGNVWFAEPQSVVRYNNGITKRFDFEEKDNSTSFIRSFSFIQYSNDSLLISSFTGNFYIYRYSNQTITPLEKEGLNIEVFHLEKMGNRILAAATEGLYELIISGETVKVNLIDQGKVYSYMVPINENRLVASCLADNAQIIEWSPSGYRVKSIPNTNFASNQIYRSRDGNLWLSSGKGLLSMSSFSFEQIKLSNAFVFTECLISDESGENVFVLSKEHIRKVNSVTGVVHEEIYDKGGYFLSGTIRNGELWVSNGFEVWNIVKGLVKKKIDLREYGRFIFDVHMDFENKLWVSQEATTGTKMIDPETQQVRVYETLDGIAEEVTAIKSTEDGVYFASGNPDAYLFFKSYDSDEIKNISNRIPEPYREEFTIEDIELRNDTIWLGTSYGLMYQLQDSLHIMSFNDDFDKLLVRTLEFSNDQLWFGTPLGLIRYNLKTGDYFHFNENTGLPTNNINEEGILITENFIWAGTPNGLARSDLHNLPPEKSATPVLLGLRINGEPASVSERPEIQHNAFIEFSFSSLSYPSKVIEYSYRIPEISEKWTIPSIRSMAEFSGLDNGIYTFEVRAKKIGNHLWSDLTSFKFVVKPSFFNTLPFYLGISVLILLSALGARNITLKVMKKRQDYLANEVQNRTSELKKANEQLSARNEELDQFVYSASHDLSAPLKSLLGLIQVMKIDDDEESRQLHMQLMEKSVHKLDAFIKEIVDYSRNSRVGLEKKPINLYNLTHEILENLSFDPNYASTEIQIDIPEDQVVHSDPVRTKIIFNNLISNGLKFQDKHKNNSYLHISFQEQNGSLHYGFKDNGLGISEESLDHIFEMFYRANQNVTHGSGLGLYITRECVLRLNGEIRVSSVAGEGSSFDVVIPKQPA